MAEDRNAMLKALDWLYDNAVNGVDKIASCYKTADHFRSRYDGNAYRATCRFVESQILICTTSGFLTNLGGLLTLPVAIPANLTSVWFVQLRMITTVAVLGGLDPKDEEVKALCYACLVGQGGIDAVKQAGIKFAKKGGEVLIKKIPSEAVKALNKKLGMRFLTKFGETGIVNLGKTVPVLGGVVGGTFDFTTTRIIANTAIRVFITSDDAYRRRHRHERQTINAEYTEVDS